jgi:anti-sigma factor RsiW
MSMACLLQDKERAAWLLGYCERNLPPALAAEVERHVAVCPDCARTVEAQQKVWAALDVWDPPQVTPNFTARLYSRIEQEEARPWWRTVLPNARVWTWKPAMPLAAACLAVLAVALFRAPSMPEPGPKAQADSIDVEQVERTLHDLEMLEQLGLSNSDKV